MADKKKAAVKTAIPQWCLEVLIDAPGQDEIDDVSRFLKENHDARQLPNVAQAAAFSLIVRYPETGARHFGNDEIEMLTRRNASVIQDTLDMLPDVSKSLIATFAAITGAKPLAKKAKP